MGLWKICKQVSLDMPSLGCHNMKAMIGAGGFYIYFFRSKYFVEEY